jgi:Transposase DDE domain group 1
MGDCQNGDLRVGFDSRLKLKFLGSQVTTDAGLLAYRELDDKLGLTVLGAGSLQDSRLGENKQHGLLPLLRQSIYGRLAGYEDVNDAERLSVDPAMRHVAGEARGLDQRSGPIRDRDAQHQEQPHGVPESLRPVGRHGAPAEAAERTDPRYGQLG